AVMVLRTVAPLRGDCGWTPARLLSASRQRAQGCEPFAPARWLTSSRYRIGAAARVPARRGPVWPVRGRSGPGHRKPTRRTIADRRWWWRERRSVTGMSPSARPPRRRWLAAAGAAVGLAAAAAWAAWPDRPGHTTVAEVVPVGPEDDGTPVHLETTLYLPDGASAADPVPAVLLAHGYGGTRDTVAAAAAELARRGYAVLTWTARGFGASGGRIHLDHPDYEGRDARLLLDRLAVRPEIRTDRPGDPHVGVVGGSYGGALALLLAAYDHRVDAVVSMTTWHDLADAFLPESSGATAEDGVFKRAWAALFFGTAAAGPGALAGPAGTGVSAPDPAPPDRTPAEPTPAGPTPAERTPAAACGRFAADLCEAYRRVAESGRGDPATVARLRESSPAGVLDRVRAPTLLIQGTADSLFPLSHADANAAGIAATGTPVRVAWFTGGHDGGPGPASERERLRRLTAGWLEIGRA